MNRLALVFTAEFDGGGDLLAITATHHLLPLNANKHC